MMGDEQQVVEQPEQRPSDMFEVVSTVASAPFEGGEIVALMQRKRRPDGKYGREFLSVKVKLDRRPPFFIHPAAFQRLLEAADTISEEVKSVYDRLTKEAQERREEWERRQSNSIPDAWGPGRSSGKTARQKAKPTYRSSDQRKADRARRHKEERGKIGRS